MGACTAETQMGEKEIAVGATADADEAFAAVGALVHGVRHSPARSPGHAPSTGKCPPAMNTVSQEANSTHMTPGYCF